VIEQTIKERNKKMLLHGAAVKIAAKLAVLKGPALIAFIVANAVPIAIIMGGVGTAWCIANPDKVKEFFENL
jgi:lipopolysaccharide export LptBFGC system permease protein LptF